MPTRKAPRKGSLQFWPRKRAKKFLPRVNWNPIKTSSDNKLKGFIGYKAGMKSVIVKDNTQNSMTKDKRISIPVTIIECPPIRIYSIRFYKKGKVVSEVLNENFEKEIKKKLKTPKNKEKISLDSIKPGEFEDVRIITYSLVKKTGIKRKPDIVEVGLSGNSVEEKLDFIKENLNKELSINNFFEEGELVDVRGLTTGRGFQGPVKRFGVTLRSHKSEKGRRGPGSIGPWHPARVTFRVPMAGQLGMFTRVIYNNKILSIGKPSDSEKENIFLKGIKNYGNVKSDYVIIRGSVQGPSKRQLILTKPLRPSKMQSKKRYELVEVV